MTDLDHAEPRVEEFCTNLGLFEEATKKAEELARLADLEHPINRSGRVTAAAAVYSAALLVNEKRTQDEVGAVADGVSSVSIRSAYAEILEHEDYPTPDEHEIDTLGEGTSPGRGVVDRIVAAVRGDQ